MMNSEEGKPGVYVPPHRRPQKIGFVRNCDGDSAEVEGNSVMTSSTSIGDSLEAQGSVRNCDDDSAEVEGNSVMTSSTRIGDSLEAQEVSMDSLPVPSEIKDKKYVIMPPVEKVTDKEEWMACGKWMWFNQEENPARLDRVWRDLQRYLSDGTFLKIKASTAAMTLSPGVIFCYTRPEENAIKGAAKAIRSVTEEKITLYYKVNLLTELNAAQRYGHKNISSYKYTANERFYRRDHSQWRSWGGDGPYENKQTHLEQRTSHDDDKLDLKHPTYFEKDGSTGWCNITCDNSDRAECGCTEANRIWAKVYKLYEENIFARIVYYKEPQVVYISCYVTSISNIESLISCIKMVTENTQLHDPVDFFICDESCDKTTRKYKLTAEGEYYEVFSHKGFSS